MWDGGMRVGIDKGPWLPACYSTARCDMRWQHTDIGCRTDQTMRWKKSKVKLTSGRPEDAILVEVQSGSRRWRGQNEQQ